jgi:hypothetical protein
VISNGARAALLGGAVVLAYAGALPGDYQFDDYNVIVHNPAVHSWAGWLASMPGIRPLLKLSYTLSWTSGLGPPGFRLFNIACHLASSLLVAEICRRVSERSGSPAGRAGEIGLAAGLLFALHPAQTEAVTYLSGRSTALMAVLYLGALAVSLRAASGRVRALSAALFAAALGAKETAWTLPLALVLVERAGGTPWRATWRAARLHAGVLGLGLLAGLATPGYRRLLWHSLSIRPPLENLLTQLDGVFYLLAQPLLLLHVNIDPGLGARASLTLDLVAKGLLLSGVLTAGLVCLRRRPWIGVALLWTLLHLVPTNALLPRLDVANDRQLYLAMLGPALLVAGGLWARLPRRAAAGALLGLVLILAAATIARNADYATEVTLWTATVAGSPHSARAWNNLGYAQQLAGDLAPARRAYARALAINPHHVRARWNLEALEAQGSGAGSRASAESRGEQAP